MRVLSFVLLFGAGLVANAAAQGDPYGFKKPGPDAAREMYFAQVRTEANQLLIRWTIAWDDDDAGKLANLYSSRATYLPVNAPRAQTRDAIRQYFASVLPSTGNAEVHLIDFGTSGDLAYLTARVSYDTRESTGQYRQLVSTDMLVLHRRSDSSWEIEMHLCRPEPTVKASE